MVWFAVGSTIVRILSANNSESQNLMQNKKRPGITLLTGKLLSNQLNGSVKLSQFVHRPKRTFSIQMNWANKY